MDNQTPTLYRQNFAVTPGSRTAVDVNELHRSVMGCFDSAASRSERAILFATRHAEAPRASFDAAPARAVMVQSLVPPTQVGRDLSPISDVTTLDPAAEVGQRVMVVVQANTASQASLPDGRRVRTPLDDAGARDWALRTLAPAFDIDPLSLNVSRSLRLRSSKGLSISMREIIADATVRDVEAVERMVVHGIGRARAYGCGLVRVVRNG